MPIIIANFLQRLRQKFQSAPSQRNIVLFSIVWVVIIGSVIYAAIEGLPWDQSLYWTIITITTVGYGDISPETPGGRVFTIIFTLIAIGIGGYAISYFAATIIEKQATRYQRTLERRRMNRIADLNNHFILCGANSVSQQIAREFQKNKTPFIIIEQDEVMLKNTLLLLHDGYFQRTVDRFLNFTVYEEGKEESLSVAELSDEVGVPYLLDDPKDDDTLINARLQAAAGLVAALPDDRDNMFVVVGARGLATRLENTSLRIMSRVSTTENMRKMYLAGADHVRIPDFISGNSMASHMLNPKMGMFLDYLLYLDANEGDELLRFRDIQVADIKEWAGKTINQLKQEYNQVVIGIIRGEDMKYIPNFDTVIEKDDVLVTIGPEPGKA